MKKKLSLLWLSFEGYNWSTFNWECCLAGVGVRKQHVLSTTVCNMIQIALPQAKAKAPSTDLNDKSHWGK